MLTRIKIKVINKDTLCIRRVLESDTTPAHYNYIELCDFLKL